MSLTVPNTTSAAQAISDLLRQPDDLLKLSAHRKRLIKEKAALDAKLAEGVKAQLDATRDALLKLQASRASVGLIREEMMALENIKEDAQGSGSASGQGGKGQGREEAFDRITRTSKMVTNLRSMSDKVDNLFALLASDQSQKLGPAGASPNLLIIHFQLQQLEAFRNETLHQAKRADAEERRILTDWFSNLDKLGEEYEKWLWEIAGRIVELVRRRNGGTVVRLLKVVEFEGKEDEKAVAMRLVRRVANTDAASKYKSMQANARVIKNYRHKLLDKIKESIQIAFADHLEMHQHDLLGFIETLNWIYKDVIRIKDDMEALFPADYEIVPYFIKTYHTTLNETLRKIVDGSPEAKVLLELHAWIKEYRVSMKELEVPAAWLQPPLLDGKSQDLIEDYVKVIISKLDEWTRNLQREEMAKYSWRTKEPEQSEDGQLGMEGVVDFFQLVNQQCDAALDSNQGAVLARVVTECASVMRRSQQQWLGAVAEEARLQVTGKPEEVPGGLVEYTIALANDQLKSADYVEALSARLEPLVSEKYKEVISAQLNEAIDGYLDVAKKCTQSLVDFVFNDLKGVTKNLLTSVWYTESLMTQIVETMRDYMSDYQTHLNPSIFDILLEDLLDAFLIVYLTAFRRAAARSLKMPISITRIRNDIQQAFDFFSTYKQPDELERNFEVLDQVLSMVGASSQMVFMDYWTFAKVHGPQMAFVEAVLRARDDLDRVVVGEVLETLRKKVKEEGIVEPEQPTIMNKVQYTQGGMLERLQQLPNLSNLGSMAKTYGGQLREYRDALQDRFDR